jgi:hypothetical protein
MLPVALHILQCQLMFPDMMLYRLGLSCYYGYLHSKYTCTNLHYKLTL